MLLADMEGDFIPNAILKKIYKRVYSEKAMFNTNFIKGRHTGDYFSFMSNLFLKAGYTVRLSFLTRQSLSEEWERKHGSTRTTICLNL